MTAQFICKAKLTQTKSISRWSTAWSLDTLISCQPLILPPPNIKNEVILPLAETYIQGEKKFEQKLSTVWLPVRKSVGNIMQRKLYPETSSFRGTCHRQMTQDTEWSHRGHLLLIRTKTYRTLQDAGIEPRATAFTDHQKLRRGQSVVTVDIPFDVTELVCRSRSTAAIMASSVTVCGRPEFTTAVMRRRSCNRVTTLASGRRKANGHAVISADVFEHRRLWACRSSRRVWIPVSSDHNWIRRFVLSGNTADICEALDATCISNCMLYDVFVTRIHNKDKL